MLRRLFGRRGERNGDSSAAVHYSGSVHLPVDAGMDSLQSGEVQVAREQSYTDLWLASLGAPQDAPESLLVESAGKHKGGKTSGGKRTRSKESGTNKHKGGDVDKTDPSFTDVWMKSLAPASDTGSSFAFKDRLDDGQEVKDGDYKVLFQVERPGVASTYLVSHQVLSPEGELVRKVAVMKRYRLADALTDDSELTAGEKFEAECQRLERVNHSQIARLLDHFVDGNYGYLVHQHIEGFALRKQIKQLGPLEEKVVLGLLLQMCDLVHHMHSHSPPIVHIDFTPDTLQMWRGNTLKLIDLSVPKELRLLSYNPEMRQSRFLAPEAAKEILSAQSNIYSLGATLFFLLTGRRPDPQGDLHPRSFNKRVSTHFDHVIAKATAPDPADRYLSISQLRNCSEIASLFHGTK